MYLLLIGWMAGWLLQVELLRVKLFHLAKVTVLLSAREIFRDRLFKPKVGVATAVFPCASIMY